MLLRNWHRLKVSIENTLDSQERLAWRQIDYLMDNPFMDKSMRVESLTRQRQYTQIIYEHVSHALYTWLNPRKHISKNARLRRKLIRGIYLEPRRRSLKSYVDSEHTIGLLRKELETAKKELATLVFGANGLLKVKGTAYVFTSELLER